MAVLYYSVLLRELTTGSTWVMVSLVQVNTGGKDMNDENETRYEIDDDNRVSNTI